MKTLKDLVSVGHQIHQVEFAEGNTAVLAQLVAGAASSPELGAAVQDGMQAWTTLVEDALARVLADTPLGAVVPLADIAYAIASLFLGLELMGGVDGDSVHQPRRSIGPGRSAAPPPDLGLDPPKAVPFVGQPGPGRRTAHWRVCSSAWIRAQPGSLTSSWTARNTPW